MYITKKDNKKEKNHAIETIKGIEEQLLLRHCFPDNCSMDVRLLRIRASCSTPYRLKGAGVKGTTKSSETGSCSETAEDGERQDNRREQQGDALPESSYRIIKGEEGRQCTNLAIRCNRR